MAKTTAKRNSKNSFEMDLDINYETDFGIDFPIGEKLAASLGDAVIKKLTDRTLGGKKLTGGKFKKYSKAYAAKKGSNQVNLKLFGDMLQSVDLEDVGLKDLKISFDSESEKPKAFNHHTGDTLPQRAWFGIQKKELKEIKRAFAPEIRQEKEKEDSQRREEEKTRRAEERAIEEIAAQIAGSAINFGNR